jgi:hypothetical protein
MKKKDNDDQLPLFGDEPPKKKDDKKKDQPPPKSSKYDSAGAASARDESMERVDEHADEEWKEAAYDSVYEVALENETLTADDVQRRLDGKPVHTHELRALGPIMLRAAKERIIEQDGTFTRSTQVQCHSMPRRIWRSLIYKQPF